MAKLDLSAGLDGLVEGKTIETSTLRDIYRGFGDLAATGTDKSGTKCGKIDQDNIREEGLDRRSFKIQEVTHVPNQPRAWSTTNFEKGSIGRWFPNWGTAATEGISFTSESDAYGGLSYPWTNFEWDPQVDTYAVIRMSFMAHRDVHSPRDYRTLHHDYTDFGLMVAPKIDGLEVAIDDPFFSHLGGIYPFQRVGLQDAFQYLGDESGPGGGIHNYDPEWWDGNYELNSSTRQSFCMFTVVSARQHPYSDETAYANFNIDKACDINAGLVWRQNKEASATKDFLSIEGFHLSVTKYRR